MVAEFMVQPSSWIESGITIETVRGLRLYKFTEEVQAHFDKLIQDFKIGQLSEEQVAEMKGLQELDRIFTLLNARIIADT